MARQRNGPPGTNDIVVLDDTFNDSIEIIDDLDEEFEDETTVAGFERLAARVERRERAAEIVVHESPDRRNEAIFERLEAQVEQRRRDRETQIEELHTRREVQGVHGRLALQNSDSQEARDGARYFTRRNRLAVLDGVQQRPRPAESDGELPASLKVTHHCPVVNCATGFTGDRNLARHVEGGKHSPCHPCQHLPNGRMVCDQLAFMCPVCGNQYNSHAECLVHMDGNLHNVFMQPLRLGGYICPQCLQVFPSKKICREHMVTESHSSFAYPFADDKGPGEPLPVPVTFVEKFQEACAKVPWSMRCITCQKVVGQNECQDHLHGDHILIAEADQAAADVFINFLKTFTCIQCLRLFDEGDAEVDTIHDCGGTVKGLIIENDILTFGEYMRRICLPVSNEAEETVAEAINTPDDDDDLNPSDEMNDLQVTAVEQATSASTSLQNRGTNEPAAKKSRSADDLSRRTSLLNLGDGASPPSDSSSVNNRKRGSPPTASPKPVTPKRTTRFSDKSPDNMSEVLNANNSGKSATKACSSRKLPLGCASTQRLNKSNSQSLQKDKSPAKITGRTILQDVNNNENIPSFMPNSRVPFHTSSFPTFAAAASTVLPSARSFIPGRQPYLPSTSFWENTRQLQNSIPNLHARPQINFANQGATGQYQFTAEYNNVPVCEKRRPVFVRRTASNTRTVDRPAEPDNLHTMKQIIFLDLDNWPGFFNKLPEPLRQGTFVWGFFGGANVWREPYWCKNFGAVKKRGEFYLHPQCGRTKDAADFALVMTVGRLDALLPKEIPFTILSGDRGFVEVERQLAGTARKMVVLNPHRKDQTLLFQQIVDAGAGTS